MKRKATGYLPENQKKTKPKEVNVVPSSVRPHFWLRVASLARRGFDGPS